MPQMVHTVARRNGYAWASPWKALVCIYGFRLIEEDGAKCYVGMDEGLFMIGYKQCISWLGDSFIWASYEGEWIALQEG